jgi:hypothetical protein
MSSQSLGDYRSTPVDVNPLTRVAGLIDDAQPRKR